MLVYQKIVGDWITDVFFFFFLMQGLLKGIPNDEPSSSETTDSVSSDDDEDGGSKEEGDTMEELQLPSVGESKIDECAEGDASVLKLVEHLQADRHSPPCAI